MTDIEKTYDTLVDFITGEVVPNIGSEANRQAVERFLVSAKGYEKKDIEVDVKINLTISGKPYQSKIDLVVSLDDIRFMAVKCAAGSLGSREREILAASRLVDRIQIPLSMVSDGKTAILLDTVSGKQTAQGLRAIPSKDQAKKLIQSLPFQPIPANRLEREKLIFRTYDSMNINIRPKNY